VRDGAKSVEAKAGGDNELMVLAAISAMLAKVAKADGHVTLDEVRCCERIFNRLGLQGEKRAYCIRVFQSAKNDSHSVFDYARSFAQAQPDVNLREIVYGVLWDLACVDGLLSGVERKMLRDLTDAMGVNSTLFSWHCRRHGIDAGPAAAPAVDDPYAVLGCRRGDSDDAVRKAYREKAKRLHPDVLRAQGLSEELLGKANDQMARINAAWTEIKKARGL